jgi:hypothetical protein
MPPPLVGSSTPHFGAELCSNLLTVGRLILGVEVELALLGCLEGDAHPGNVREDGARALFFSEHREEFAGDDREFGALLCRTVCVRFRLEQLRELDEGVRERTFFEVNGCCPLAIEAQGIGAFGREIDELVERCGLFTRDDVRKLGIGVAVEFTTERRGRW